MRKLELMIVAVNRFVVAAVLAFMLTIVFINVLGRYGFGNSIAWVEESARHLMILGAFCGAGLALREGRLVAITMIPDFLPVWLGSILRWGIVIAMFVFMASIFWLGVQFVEFGWNKETMSTGISRGIPYLAIPLGALLFLIHLCFFAARFVKQDFEYDSGVLSTGEEC